MLHNASLLLDDIEDGSELRRGAPTAHKVFGEALTINSANYLYFVALEKVLLIKIFFVPKPAKECGKECGAKWCFCT